MTNETYNGWRNKETWLTNLWLTNNEDSYQVLREALEVEGEGYEKAYWLQGQLQWQLENEIGTASLWQDLLSTAFNRVSWDEVIQNNLES